MSVIRDLIIELAAYGISLGTSLAVIYFVYIYYVKDLINQGIRIVGEAIVNVETNLNRWAANFLNTVQGLPRIPENQIWSPELNTFVDRIDVDVIQATNAQLQEGQTFNVFWGDLENTVSVDDVFNSLPPELKEKYAESLPKFCDCQGFQPTSEIADNFRSEFEIDFQLAEQEIQDISNLQQPTSPPRLDDPESEFQADVNEEVNEIEQQNVNLTDSVDYEVDDFEEDLSENYDSPFEDAQSEDEVVQEFEKDDEDNYITDDDFDDALSEEYVSETELEDIEVEENIVVDDDIGLEVHPELEETVDDLIGTLESENGGDLLEQMAATRQAFKVSNVWANDTLIEDVLLTERSMASELALGAILMVLTVASTIICSIIDERYTTTQLNGGAIVPFSPPSWIFKIGQYDYSHKQVKTQDDMTILFDWESLDKNGFAHLVESMPQKFEKGKNYEIREISRWFTNSTDVRTIRTQDVKWNANLINQYYDGNPPEVYTRADGTPYAVSNNELQKRDNLKDLLKSPTNEDTGGIYTDKDGTQYIKPPTGVGKSLDPKMNPEAFPSQQNKTGSFIYNKSGGWLFYRKEFIQPLHQWAKDNFELNLSMAYAYLQGERWNFHRPLNVPDIDWEYTVHNKTSGGTTPYYTSCSWNSGVNINAISPIASLWRMILGEKMRPEDVWFLTDTSMWYKIHRDQYNDNVYQFKKNVSIVVGIVESGVGRGLPIALDESTTTEAFSTVPLPSKKRDVNVDIQPTQNIKDKYTPPVTKKRGIFSDMNDAMYTAATNPLALPLQTDNPWCMMWVVNNPL